jgi:hypothetical protein
MPQQDLDVANAGMRRTDLQDRRFWQIFRDCIRFRLVCYLDHNTCRRRHIGDSWRQSPNLFLFACSPFRGPLIHTRKVGLPKVEMGVV